MTLTGLNPGNNNTLMFSNPIVGDWAPDFDRIEVSCTIPPPATLRPQDLFSWSSPGVRNLTTDGSRYFSIDSGNTNVSVNANKSVANAANAAANAANSAANAMANAANAMANAANAGTTTTANSANAAHSNSTSTTTTTTTTNTNANANHK